MSKLFYNGMWKTKNEKKPTIIHESVIKGKTKNKLKLKRFLKTIKKTVAHHAVKLWTNLQSENMICTTTVLNNILYILFYSPYMKKRNVKLEICIWLKFL